VFASFLPSDVEKLTESTSIALAEKIQRQDIVTSLTPEAIATSYVHFGNGNPPILFLHGFDGSLLEGRRLLPLLSTQYQTYAIDLLGFGFTDRMAGSPFNPTAIKTHLYYTWKTLIHQPMILIGVSMGGGVALDFTLTYPEAVQKLVLIDSAGFAKGPAIGKYLIPPLGYLATEFLRNPNVRRKISLNAYKDPKFATKDSDVCASLHLKMPGWSQALIDFTKSGGYNFLANHTAEFAKIQQDTLVLWGDSDIILGTGDAEKFTQVIPNSRLIWIENCGHVPHLEQAEVTAKHILDFVA
jgi:pimeloyl-ACP methyl ester carboxylesterase